MSFFQDKTDVQRLISTFDVFLQQELLLPKKGSVNLLIMNFNQNLVSVTLGWLSFSVKVFLFKGCPGRVCVPLTFAFWTHTGSETTGRTHIPLPRHPRLGSSRGSCHLATTIITCHCRGNPAGGPPSKCLPALAQSKPGQGADTQEPGWVPGSPDLRRGATSAPAYAHAPYILGAHSGAHPCARAPPHSGVRPPRRTRDCRVGGGPEWSRAFSRVSL